MRALTLILILTIMMGCSNDDQEIDGFNLQNQIMLGFKTPDGQNLLDKTTEGSYNIENMFFSYFINDEPVEKTIEDGLKNGGIELTSENLLTVYLYPSRTNIVEETAEYKIVENVAYLQLSETDTDTIRTQAKTGYNYFILTKVWYNNELVWNVESGGVIEIIKE